MVQCDWDEEKFRLAVEAAPNAMIMVDSLGKILFVNRQTEKVFGYSRDELMGRPIEMLVPERFRSKHPDYRHGFSSDPATRPMGAGRDLFGLCKDGKEIPVEIGLNPIMTGDGLVVLSSIIDITERKKIEEMKENFLSTVSHELRTPLAVLKMGLEELGMSLAEKLSGEDRETLEAVTRNARSLDHLIGDLLDLSRLQSEKTRMNPQLVRIPELIDGIFREFQILTKRQEVALERDLEPDLPPIQADPEMLIRALSNLLNNAVHFARSKVTISVRRQDSRLQVSVVDDGPGIEEKDLPSLFNRFVQINRPPGGSGYKGTGLGLAICKEIVQLHEGRVWAESIAGKGARFHIELPLGLPRGKAASRGTALADARRGS